MHTRCHDHLEGLTDLALGRTAPEAAAHLEGCARCRGTLSRFSRMATALTAPVFDAPPGLIAAAQALMPAPVRRRMTLRTSTLAMTGARAAATEGFQATFAEDDLRVRIMATPLPEGWEVRGRVESPGWEVLADAPLEESPEGFRLVAERAEGTEITLAQGDRRFVIPSVAELLASGTGDDR